MWTSSWASRITGPARPSTCGGGREVSLSLREATELCREPTGREVPLASVAEPRPQDPGVYISDCARLFGLTDWRPRRDARETMSDTFDWILANERSLRSALA